ncbi:MAG: hypothetical protein IIB53_11920 [Planctomycetes bacterium]|nr:hypothetical protein [Planctomycetota bacterium]
METFAHRRLKELAVSFLRDGGCLAVATEVRCPISRYRVDAAGYQDSVRDGAPNRRRRRRCPPTTIVIECKQSRADFFRDAEQTEALLARRADLQLIRQSIEEHRVKLEEPHLRRSGSALFVELEEWDFAASRLPSYRKVLGQLQLVDEKLHGHTKFHLITRYQLADRLYLAAPRGMIRHCEVPPGWGLLECPPQWLDQDRADERQEEPAALRTTVEAPELRSRDDRRVRLLRNIAVSASFAALDSTGPRRVHEPANHARS